jgi:hypothetical protein
LGQPCEFHLPAQLYDLAATKDKTIRIYPGLMHGECMYQKDVYADVGAWLDTRSA